VGVAGNKKTLIELLHVSFASVWVSGESNDSEQPSCNESLEDTWGMCRCSWDVEV